MKELVRTLVREAVRKCVENGEFSLSDPDSLSIEVSRTKDPKFGDYATNVAMVLAKQAKKKPRDLARMIEENLGARSTVIQKTEIAGPGFLNFFLEAEIWHELLHKIHHEKGCFGHTDTSGPRVLVEFVSANPTGPLHVGHGRGAAVGDTLARLLKACGYDVDTEYYVNDAGNQMRILGTSVLLRYRQAMGEEIDFPTDHYQGDYIGELADEVKADPAWDKLLTYSEADAVDRLAAFACERILEGIDKDLEFFGVHYDNYFSEKKLHEAGDIEATVNDLRERNRVEDKDGAVWFTMDDSEDEKDRVLVRASGEPTYFAADAAYHRDKCRRGYDLLVDIWGADHHGYVPRVKAALEALGNPPEALQVLLVQFVRLVREGQKEAMSTRSGEFITLREVLDEVGPDAARFFFLTKRCDSHLDFDLDLAKKQSRDNPVYYVQYAHARVASIFRIAGERDIDTDMTDPDLFRLALPEEMKLIKHLADFPDMLLEAARAFEPHRLTFYLMELAELFHAYYHDNRVLTEDSELKKARLYLVEAVRQVVANGLTILGVQAPDRM